MKSSVKTLLVAPFALVLLLAAADTADAAHRRNFGVSFGWSNHHGSFGFAAGRYGSPPPRIYGGFCPTPVVPVYAPPVHVHDFCVTTRSIWVEPVYEQVFCGYDCYGRPIYRSVCVREGSYRTARYNTCGCGHSVFLGY